MERPNFLVVQKEKLSSTQSRVCVKAKFADDSNAKSHRSSKPSSCKMTTADKGLISLSPHLFVFVCIYLYLFVFVTETAIMSL